MDLQRAKEIVQSPETISVMYQGSPVWIESLNDADNAADVVILAGNERVSVPLNFLVENS